MIFREKAIKKTFPPIQNKSKMRGKKKKKNTVKSKNVLNKIIKTTD